MMDLKCIVLEWNRFRFNYKKEFIRICLCGNEIC